MLVILVSCRQSVLSSMERGMYVQFLFLPAESNRGKAQLLSTLALSTEAETGRTLNWHRS